MEKPCEVCGTMFRFKRSHEGRAKYCSKRCLGIANGRRERAAGRVYQPGHTPWMKLHGKGQRFSPSTEFKPGQSPENRLLVGSERVRRCKNGELRAFVKVAEPNVWKLRALVVWEASHGPLPRGLLIHHRDRDTLNDAPENLQALTRSAHAREHRDDLIQARRTA